MKVEELLHEQNLISDATEVFVRDEDLRVLAHGSWYQDNVLAHMDDDVESFTWQNDGKVFIDVVG